MDVSVESVVESESVMSDENSWVTVCGEEVLAPDTGVCAMLGGEQVAIFRVGQTGQVFAVSNYDPIGEANVLSRGIIGSLGDEIVVASPLYKQHFSLKTGACLEQGDCSLKTYPVRLHRGEVQLRSA